MVLDPLRFPVVSNDACVCGRVIPDGETYYGFELDPDNDAPIAWAWHDHCLAEWGFARCDENDPRGVLGIRHLFCSEESDEILA